MNDSFINRLNFIIAGFLHCVGVGGVARGMPVRFMQRIAAQLFYIRARLPQAIARAALPTRQRPPRPYIPRPPRIYPPTDTWRAIRLPRHEGWLLRRLPGVPMHGYGIHYLRYLLAEPEMAALAGTPRAHRLLRPLCRMLGISDCLPPLAPPGAPPAVPTPAAISTRPPPMADADKAVRDQPCPPDRLILWPRLHILPLR